jgi:hypothetical protein
MVDQGSEPHDGDPFRIELDIAQLARVENYLTGGDANFAVDRAAAESIAEASPGGLEGLRDMIEAVKGFVARAVTVLSTEAGVRQYVHIGMSTPTTGMVHHVASKIRRDSRVVYVSWDPTTLAHIHKLGVDDDEGVVAHVQARFDETGKILGEAANTLDFDEPVAVALPTTLTLVADDDEAQRIVDDLCGAIAPGSFLIFAHTGLDLVPPGTERAVEQFTKAMDESYVLRTRAQIGQMLADLELIDPGLVLLDEWRPDVDPKVKQVPIYAAVGRKLAAP